jgi:hypothetical protein
MEKINNSSIGFIIPICIQSEIHLNQLNRCINSIARYHPNINIILLNDTPPNTNANANTNTNTNNTITTEDINIMLESFKNVLDITIVNSLKAGSGELQTFKVFLEYANFDKAIIIQDSMTLLEPLPANKLDSIEDVQFLWHFTNHILQWDSILESPSEYNSKNYITTHTDLLIDCIISDFRDNIYFQKFAINRLRQLSNNNDNGNRNGNGKHNTTAIGPVNWVGCFGCCCVITKSAIRKMQKIVPFVDILVKYSNRRYRCATESLFALICHYVFPDNDYSNSFDGLYYDGISVNPYNGSKIGLEDNLDDNLDDNLEWCARNKYIGKISFNR